MPYRVFTYYPRAKEVVRHLTDAGVDVTFVYPHEITLAAACGAIRDCDAMIEDKSTNIGVGKTLIDAAKRLKVIVSPSTGYDTIDVAYAQTQGIYVTNAAGASTVAVAEATILLMLACNRNFSKIDERFRKLKKDYPFFDFNDPTVRGVELRGKTLGLIGCGAIGRTVARIAAQGFGMNVVGFDPYLCDYPEYLQRRKTQAAVFEEGDFISLHLPSTPLTVHSIGAKEFALMKKTAYFINASRGNIVRQEELITALEMGEIAGAGLDVYDPEPLDESSYRLFELPNVCITPHTAAFTREASGRYSEYEAQSLIEVSRGEIPTRRVNDPIHPRLSH